ncbi:hypothetical protein AB0E85_19235 [Streptomyces sp. NPDC029044]|uniref:hypothetical protein n=1 Tax=Streptomyces sp. NPDC029044 TaxID=3157198 RepID=UPI0033EC9F12
MGIRTLLRRTAPGMALPPAPAFEAAASTVRVPVTFTTALRLATADLRQRLAPRGRRPTSSADTGDLTAAPSLASTEALAGLTGLADAETLAALTGLADAGTLSAVIGVHAESAGPGPSAGVGHLPSGTRPSGTPGTPGKPSRPWARLARDYLTLVLTLLPRPRPAHTTITVYITTDSTLSEQPDGSAPSRRRGQDRWGPEPDAAP